MADAKISALTNLTAADPTNDMIPIVDVSDTPPASGNTKRISINNILSSSPTASGALTVTGLVTAGSASITGAATVGTTLGVTGVSTFAAGTAALPALTTTGDTNTGIYYPAADTFAVTTGGTERYRVDSTGLGIGGSPSYKLSAIGTTNNQVVLHVGNTAGSSDGDTTNVVRFAAGSGANALWANARYDGFAHAWRCNSTTTQAMTLDASGNLLVGVASANANGGVLQLKSGITFPATQVAASDANTLDDYEEGTWTPALATDTVNFTSVGYSTQAAKYTKVGNLVTFAGTIQTSSVVKGLASGAVVITGLPFAQPSTDSRGDANCFSASAWAVDCPLSGEIITSTIYLLKRATSVSATATLAVADVSTGGSNNFVRFSGQYYV